MSFEKKSSSKEKNHKKCFKNSLLNTLLNFWRYRRRKDLIGRGVNLKKSVKTINYRAAARLVN